MAEGGNLVLQKFLSIDLSNALGFGLNYGEAIRRGYTGHIGKRLEGVLQAFETYF